MTVSPQPNCSSQKRNTSKCRGRSSDSIGRSCEAHLRGKDNLNQLPRAGDSNYRKWGAIEQLTSNMTGDYRPRWPNCSVPKLPMPFSLKLKTTRFSFRRPTLKLENWVVTAQQSQA